MHFIKTRRLIYYILFNIVLVRPISRNLQNLRHGINFSWHGQTLALLHLNLLSANPTKWSETLKQFVGNLPINCLSVFDYFVGLALTGLNRNTVLGNHMALLGTQYLVKSPGLYPLNFERTLKSMTCIQIEGIQIDGKFKMLPRCHGKWPKFPKKGYVFTSAKISQDREIMQN